MWSRPRYNLWTVQISKSQDYDILEHFHFMLMHSQRL